jgi:proline dehydrogenase
MLGCTNFVNSFQFTAVFTNTEIAFRSKSDRQLRNACRLFKTVASKSAVKAGKILLQAAQRVHFPVAWLVKPTIYAHFTGGESIGECGKVVRMLEHYHVRAILDYAVEGKRTEEGIGEALEETLRTIDNAAMDDNVAFAVFKPSAFMGSHIPEKDGTGMLPGLKEEEAARFRERVDLLCRTAFDKQVRILVDAEESWYQDIVDEAVTGCMEKYNSENAVVYNTYQMYRRDRLEALKAAHQRAVGKGYILGAKFVRGAYMEKERKRAAELGYTDPIHPDKECTDRDFNAALEYSVRHIDRIHILNGTHNEYSSQYLTCLMEDGGISRNDPRCFFSQLYGMSDHISFNLADRGYNVAKYLPYGPVRSLLPYLIRRSEENTSIAGQTGRELSLIREERRRRKQSKGGS